MTIDTVTFDVWNTLVVHEFYDDRLKIHRMKSVRQALIDQGYQCTCDQMIKAYEYTEEALTSVWKNERDLGNDGHLALLLEGLDMEPDDDLLEIIREPYSHALLQFQPKLVDGAYELLVSLKEKGYKIGLISNTGRTPGRTMRQVLKGYGLADCFNAMTFSDETGHIKPGRLSMRSRRQAWDRRRIKPSMWAITRCWTYTVQKPAGGKRSSSRGTWINSKNTPLNIIVQTAGRPNRTLPWHR